MQHSAIKVILYLPNDEEVFWLLLLSLVFVLSGSVKQPKTPTPISCLKKLKHIFFLKKYIFSFFNK